MKTRRLLSGPLLLALCAALVLPAVGNAGLFSKSPKTPPLLGSHPSSDAKNAREALLKERNNTITTRKVKPGKTITSQRQKPGRTILGQPVKH